MLEVVGLPPCAFPLLGRRAGRYVLPRLALVGGAAHSVHPLAGQGANLGLGDVRVLTNALAAAGERRAAVPTATSTPWLFEQQQIATASCLPDACLLPSSWAGGA